MQLQIDKANALKAYNKADEKGKTLLSDLFGKEVFSQKITDRVKTFEDACEVLGLDPKAVLPEVHDSIVDDMLSIRAYTKLIIIARALNEGWTPDWSNTNQYKWFPWFKHNAGFGFSLTDFGLCYSSTGVGSRLCFKTEELAEYAGKQFEVIYNHFLTIQ